MRTRSMFLVWAILLAGCGNTPPPASPVPGATPSPSRTASPSPSPSPTDHLTEVPAFHVPANAIRSLSADTATIAFGSSVFTVDVPKGVASATISMVDLQTGASTLIAHTISGHDIVAMAATGNRLAWVETWRNHPSPRGNGVPSCPDAGKPLEWRIVVASLAARSQLIAASGTNVRTAVDGECADVNPPLIAVDGDRIAYTQESPSADKPFANRIAVRSLTDGFTIRTIPTDGLAEDLALSGPVIAYRDNLPSDPSLGAVDPFDGRLMVSTADDSPPVELDDHVSALGLGDGRIAWTHWGSTDGSVSTEPIGSATPIRLTVAPVIGFKPDRALQIAVGSGAIAWLLDGTDNDDVGTTRLAIWTPAGVGPTLVEGVDLPGFVSLSNGWLVWSTDVVHGVPASVLAAP